MSIKLEKVPTGLPGLDHLTLGGLPKGRTTLIAGKSGAAKSILELGMKLREHHDLAERVAARWSS